MVISMRRLDEVGRITIPRELIQRLGWSIKSKDSKGTPLIIEEVGDTVVLKAYKETCLICGIDEGLEKVNENDYICSDCLDGLKEYLERRDK